MLSCPVDAMFGSYFSISTSVVVGIDCVCVCVCVCVCGGEMAAKGKGLLHEPMISELINSFGSGH